MVETRSQLQDAPKCRAIGCGAVSFLFLSLLILTLCIDYVVASPWASLPELGQRRYFYDIDGQFCRKFGRGYANASKGRAFAIKTREECALAAASFRLNFSESPDSPCVNGCCINNASNALLFSESVRIYPNATDFPAVCTSRNLNLYKISAVVGIVIAGFSFVGSLAFFVVLTLRGRVLRSAYSYIQNNPGNVFSVEISFGALQRQQETLKRNSCSSDCCAVITVSLVCVAVSSLVLTVVVTPNRWISQGACLGYVVAFSFMVGVGSGCLLVCVRLVEKIYGEKARARSLSYMQMHLFIVEPGANNIFARDLSVCIVRGDKCYILRSPESVSATLEHRGLNICSSELVKERVLEQSASLAFADWALKVDCAKVIVEANICGMTTSALHFYFEGDDEALRLNSWLQATPAFRYRGWRGNSESGGSCRVITLKRQADARIVGSLMSGAPMLEIEERQDELVGSLRYRLAESLRVHASRIALFREGAPLYDRLAAGNLDGVVVSERREPIGGDTSIA